MASLNPASSLPEHRGDPHVPQAARFSNAPPAGDLVAERRQMIVAIDQAGQHCHSAAINDLRTGGNLPGVGCRYIGNVGAIHNYCGVFEQAAFAVDQSDIGYCDHFYPPCLPLYTNEEYITYNE